MGSKWSKDDALIWLSGSALVLCFLMVAGLVLVIVVQGLDRFWLQDLTRYVLRDGRIILGHETSVQAYVPPTPRVSVPWRTD